MKKELILPFVLILFVTLGCSQLNELANTSSEPANVNTSNTTATNSSDVPPSGNFAPSADAKADIEKMADRFLTLKSFRAKMDSEGEMPMNAVLEFVAPDRYRLQTGTGMETIIIGKTTYMNIGGTWRKMPVSLDSSITDMRATFDKEGMKWFSDVRYVGSETVDGRSAYVYAYHNKGPGAGEGENDSKIWIGTDDGLPIKVEATYRSGSLDKMTISYDHKAPVSIEPPVK